MKQYRLKDTDLEWAIRKTSGVLFDELREQLHNAVVYAHKHGHQNANVMFAIRPADDPDGRGICSSFAIGLANFEEVEVYSPNGWNDPRKIKLPTGKTFLVHLVAPFSANYLTGWTDAEGHLRLSTSAVECGKVCMATVKLSELSECWLKDKTYRIRVRELGDFVNERN